MLRSAIKRSIGLPTKFAWYSKMKHYNRALEIEERLNSDKKNAPLLMEYLEELKRAGRQDKLYAEYILRRDEFTDEEQTHLHKVVASTFGFTAIPITREGERYRDVNKLMVLWALGLISVFYLVTSIDTIIEFFGRNEGGSEEKKKVEGNSQEKNNNKSNANIINLSISLGGDSISPEKKLKERFSDVVGIDEFRNELEEIVDYLKNPKKYTSLGATFPRGILLSGPPGTGKTLIARAIAGEAKCSFFYKSGSQFDEMYRGSGKDNVKKLFEEAKKAAPAIVFVDEIDSLAGKRKYGGSRNSINQLLTELDGFTKNENVIFIAATNLEDSLDPALLRSGRIDKVIRIPLPDITGRQKILDYYVKRIQSEYQDTSTMAKRTIGFSGAELKNYVNTAILHAIRRGNKSAKAEDFEYSFDRIQMGVRRKNPLLALDKRRETAYRQVAQAVAAYYTEGANKFYKVTILPSGSSLGHVALLPNKNELSMSRKNIIAQIDVAMAGRAAEDLFYGEERSTTASSRDLARAANLAYYYIRDMGMAENELFINNEPDKLSDAYKYKSDLLVQKVLGESLGRTKSLLASKRNKIERLVGRLLEKETLTLEDFETEVNSKWS